MLGYHYRFSSLCTFNGFASRKFVSTNITKVNVNKRQFSAKWRHWCSGCHCNQLFWERPAAQLTTLLSSNHQILSKNLFSYPYPALGPYVCLVAGSAFVKWSCKLASKCSGWKKEDFLMNFGTKSINSKYFHGIIYMPQKLK